MKEVMHENVAAMSRRGQFSTQKVIGVTPRGELSNLSCGRKAHRSRDAFDDAHVKKEAVPTVSPVSAVS